jgi:bifunctional non-homologous end joining protein LigD
VSDCSPATTTTGQRACPLILEAANLLRARSCLIDGEAVCCDDNGLAAFKRLRHKHDAFLYAFDLLELDGMDLRREPIETRKATLASLLRGSRAGLRLNGRFEYSGDVVFRHPCKSSAARDRQQAARSPYRSGRSKDWIKMKNPNAPAVVSQCFLYSLVTGNRPLCLCGYPT